MNREILLYPDPRLRAEALPVAAENIEKELSVMRDVLLEHSALGLAAPQLGWNKQVFLLRREAEIWTFVNPEILFRAGSSMAFESCLSLPRERVSVLRAETVGIRAENDRREVFEIELRDLDARVAQHEIDHLRGKLLLDHAAEVLQG